MPWVYKADDTGQIDYEFQPEYFEDEDDAFDHAAQLKRVATPGVWYRVMGDDEV